MYLWHWPIIVFGGVLLASDGLLDEALLIVRHRPRLDLQLPTSSRTRSGAPAGSDGTRREPKEATRACVAGAAAAARTRVHGRCGRWAGLSPSSSSPSPPCTSRTRAVRHSPTVEVPDLGHGCRRPIRSPPSVLSSHAGDRRGADRRGAAGLDPHHRRGHRHRRHRRGHRAVLAHRALRRSARARSATLIRSTPPSSSATRPRWPTCRRSIRRSGTTRAGRFAATARSGAPSWNRSSTTTIRTWSRQLHRPQGRRRRRDHRAAAGHRVHHEHLRPPAAGGMRMRR